MSIKGKNSMTRTRARRASFDDLAIRRGALTADDLIGLELTLEYTDANSERTKRKVHIIRYYDDRKPTLYCYCHKRREERSFLIERIGAVIDSDGVALAPYEFSSLFGLHVAASFPIQKPNESGRANATGAKGFSALAATEARLSSADTKDRRWKLTKGQAAALVALLLLVVALAA